MDTQVAARPQSNQALATPNPDYVPVAGYEGLDPDDFSLPTLKLVQAQTTTDGAEEHQGEYVKTDTQEFFKTPRLLVMGIQKSRIMFPAEYGGADSAPLCRSDDSTHPREEFVGSAPFDDSNIIPEACSDCPFSKWGKNGDAPACTLSENYAGILDSGDIVILRLKGSSAKASTTLKNTMRANRFKGLNTYIQLASSFKKTEKGRFFVSTVTLLKESAPAESLDLLRQFAGLNLAARAADEAPEPARQPAGSQFDQDIEEDSLETPF